MSEIDDFLARVDEPQRKLLEHVRELIKATCPDSIQVISYGMPAFKYKGKYLIGYSNFKNHMSLFPGAEVTEILKDALSKYKLSKGTIQFTLDNPITDSLVKEIIQIRMIDIDKSN